jgi:hypothetical protein
MRARVEVGEREAGASVKDGGRDANERGDGGDRDYRPLVRTLRSDDF